MPCPGENKGEFEYQINYSNRIEVNFEKSWTISSLPTHTLINCSNPLLQSNEIKWNQMKSNENWRDSELAVRSIRKHGQRIIYVESQASSRGKGETAQKWQVERVHLAGVSSNTHGNKALKNLQQMVAPIRSNREMNQWFHGICLFLSLIKIGTKTATIRCWRQHGCYRRHDDSTNCYLYFVIE